MLTTPDPVANDCGGSDDDAVAIIVGRVRPTPTPVRSIPPRTPESVVGSTVTASAHHETPTPKATLPTAMTRAGP